MRKDETAGTAGPSLHNFTFPDFNISELTTTHILQNSAELPSTERRGFFDIQPYEVDVNYGAFRIAGAAAEPFKVVVKQNEQQVNLYCACNTPKKNLCEHQIQVLYNLMRNKELRAFFDKKLRFEKIRPIAVDYGLDKEPDLDIYFQMSLVNKELVIRPMQKEMIPVSPSFVTQLADQLATQPTLQFPGAKHADDKLKTIAVFGVNKYYEHFFIELYEASVTGNGKLKNPLTLVNPLEKIWSTEETAIIKFHTAVSAFQNNFRKKKAETDIAGLKSILKNPLEIDFYYHDSAYSENVAAASLIPVRLEQSVIDMQLHIDRKDRFYHISGYLILDGIYLDLDKVQMRYDYFVLYQDSLYLIDSEDILNAVLFFKQHNQKIIIHESKFEDFRLNVLAKIENRIGIIYSYLKPATEQQKEEQGFNNEISKIIYLEDFGQYVLITPVVKYGKVEVALFSRKEIYSVDSHGNPFTVARDNDLENRFGGALLRQHPDFEEQLGKNFFHLHKNQFLDENWFLDVFEEWQDQGISILGFNTLTKNRVNLHKAKVSVHVISGINWFNTTANVKFGKQNVTLKNLHKAVKNRNKYVELGDGTLGILPENWIEKFAKFFEAGEIVEETIRTPKVNFISVSEMYDEELLDREVREQIAFYRSKFESFDSIPSVAEPAALKATLRDYQKQGLNWLNFLDDFNFGGCLADDMGLGKTVQIIAFLLSQKEKHGKKTNLIIVPTSLIFNWQDEIRKFAPDLEVLTIYGSDRIKETGRFDHYDVVLTSYGTLLLDVNYLKKYHFNYIILDESQAIKNPESQRYKAARLLQSRNKLVLTGTPVENNTFDLYGQLSFACPGLLGSKFHFKHHFSTPIDRFKENDRAKELQKRINPFILRRTKKQVATELPDKTEMVIYCEMGNEQRKVYNAYELEFFTFLNTTSEVDIERSTLHVLQGLTKLRQICNSPALLNDDAFYGNASAKIDTLMEQIETKSPQHKILVFSQFVTMLDLIRPELEKRNIGFEYLTGQTKDRASKVENFQSNPDIRVFLISMKAGGTGLNLTEADYVYIIDPWWNPAVENQAIDRSYRIGQKKNVIAVRLICPDTIEEKMMELQESKKDLANDLVKTDTSILKALTRSDLLGLVSNPNPY